MIPLETIQPGDQAKHIPTHAEGDANHKDCETGVVKSKNDTYAFVNYIRNGILQQTAQATRPEDLIYNS